MLVGTLTIPVASLKSTFATSTSLSYMTMVPLVIGLPVVASINVTTTLVLPATTGVAPAAILLSRCFMDNVCVVTFSLYVLFPTYLTTIFSVVIGTSRFITATPSLFVVAVPTMFSVSPSMYTLIIPSTIGVVPS